MDAKKLAALRKAYGGAAASEVHDPEFKKVVDLLFSGGERRAKPYEGVSTFLDLPLALDAPSTADFGGLDVAVVRQVERIGPYHDVLRVVPRSHLKAADVGDVPFTSRYSLEQSHTDIEAYYTKLVSAGVRPLSVGGDHSISLPILKAVGKDRPVGMIHIDAHCDTSGPFEGSKFHHGGPFREAVLAGVLDPERTIQIGIRGNAEYLWEFSGASGMTVVHAHTFADRGMAWTLGELRRVVGTGPVYVSFDVDSLDPAFAPGTGTPEVGGLLPREVLVLLRGAAGLDIVGGDVVEVAPQYDATTVTAQNAAQVLFEIFTLMALAPSLGRRPATN
jgi:guanidinopropionase